MSSLKDAGVCSLLYGAVVGTYFCTRLVAISAADVNGWSLAVDLHMAVMDAAIEDPGFG